LTSGEKIREQAAEWVIRSGVPGFPDHAAFEAWRDADRRHAAAFEKARALWGELAHDPALSSLSSQAPRPVHVARRRMILGAIAASLVAMIGVGLSDDFLIVMQSDLRTPAGMHLDRKLPDGSRIELDDTSAVALDFTGTERRLRLLRGQIFVEAAPIGWHERRPFVVEAMNGKTRALGTSFNVNMAGSGAVVDVTAVTHRVSVETTGPSSPSRKPVLSPGQGLRYDTDGGMAVRATSPALATAWRHDRIILDQVTLAEACAVLRRYSKTSIRLFGGQGGARRISGVFDARDVEGTLRLIAGEHGLRLVKVPLFGFFLT
jgi:transmembrane sensor